jgi:hypothetical protein
VTKATWIVDSSKDPARAMSLAGCAGIDLRIIHLVRDPRGVAYSLMKTIDRNPRAGVPRGVDGLSARAAAQAWKTADGAANRVARRFPPDRVLGIRYEMILEDPSRVRSMIADFLGVDGTCTQADPRAVSSGHIAAGNRVRMNDSLIVRDRDEWTMSMASDARRVVEQTCRRSMRRLDYSVAADARVGST